MILPKPTKKKRRLLKNERIREYTLCEVCKERQAIDTHEVYPGNGRRQICIKHGFQVKVCRKCHTGLQQYEPEYMEKLKYWQQKFQREYEKKHTREEFRRLIGKSYI